MQLDGSVSSLHPSGDATEMVVSTSAATVRGGGGTVGRGRCRLLVRYAGKGLWEPGPGLELSRGLGPGSKLL